MKKGQFIVLAGIIVVSLGVLAGLYALSPMSKEMYRAAFVRKFMNKYFEEPEVVMDIMFNSFYIAGYSDKMLYLGNSTAPFNLRTVNFTLTDSAHILLDVKLDSVVNPEYFKLSVVPPNFYLANGIQPIILKGDTLNWSAAPFMQDSGYYFTDAVCVRPETFVLKSYSTQTKENDLAKKTVGGLTFHNDLLEKQVDGIFCVDGRLLFNKTRSHVIYLYHYRNEFIVADTNLKVNYRGHTIDPFSRAQIKVNRIGNDGESMLGAPPVTINGLSCTDGDFLYIKSNLLAKNEDMKQFKSGSTIDCYRLTDGQYVGSFHIPNYKKEKLLGFQVVNDKLFAMFGRYLTSYSLHPELLVQE